jgi:hypothetical protein
MKEKKAKGTKGFLLYSPTNLRYFFRVYNKKNPRKFKDYDIRAEEVKIELLSNFNSLITNDDGSRVLDFSSKVLGKD